MAYDKITLIQEYRNHLSAAPTVTGAFFQIDTFLLFDLLGWGGMAAVFLAVDKESGRRVVVKLPLPEKLYDADFAALFEREQSAASVLGTHDNIVFFDTFGKFTSTTGREAPFLVLQYIAGRTLEAKIRTWTYLPQKEVCRIGIELCQALDFMHSRHTHRDIKPANVLLDALNGEALKLVDFGLAISVDHTSDPLSGVCGTAGYIAPERFSDPVAHRNSPKADLFSVGCVLYEALTGRKAFQTLAENFSASFHPQWPCTIRRNLDSELSSVIEALLSRDPAKRPTSAREVENCLKRIEPKLPFETDTSWPVVSDSGVATHLAEIGREQLPPCTSGIRNTLAETMGLMERMYLSNEIHNDIRKFGDGIQTGFLQEVRKKDPEQVSKSLVDALKALTDWRVRLVQVAYRCSRLTAFSGRTTALSEQLLNHFRLLETHAISAGLPVSAKALGDSAELSVLDMSRCDDLEAILWSIWKELVGSELAMVGDHLFVADLLTVALHRIEMRLG